MQLTVSFGRAGGVDVTSDTALAAEDVIEFRDYKVDDLAPGDLAEMGVEYDEYAEPYFATRIAAGEVSVEKEES